MMPTFRPDPRSPITLATTLELTRLLDGSLKAHRDAEPARAYLGASAVGVECQRQAAYGYFKTPKDPDKGFTGRTYRVFDMGHDSEARMATYLRLAGFDLRTEQPNGKQFGFSVCEGRFAGHIDGVIMSGPKLTGMSDSPWPMLWENKALNDDGYRACVHHRVHKAKRMYYAQVQLYEAYMQLESCLFTVVNRDSGEVYAEVIDIDVAHAQEMSDRAARILKATQPTDLPRISSVATDYRCKWCDFAISCWSDQSTPADIPTQGPQVPIWLQTRGARNAC